MILQSVCKQGFRASKNAFYYVLFYCHGMILKQDAKAGKVYNRWASLKHVSVNVVSKQWSEEQQTGVSEASTISRSERVSKGGAAGAQKQDLAMNIDANNALQTLSVKQESSVAMFVVPNSGKTVT